VTGAVIGRIHEVVRRTRRDEPLGRHTTLGVGGPADVYAEPATDGELAELLKIARGENLPVLMVGQGSNLLISDSGFRGIAIHLRGDFEKIEIKGDVFSCGAAAKLPQLIHRSADANLAGLEVVTGIPGSVGGALITNAGTSEGSIGPLIREVTMIEESGPVTWKLDDLNFQYRSSNLAGKVITSARLRLKTGNKKEIEQRVGDMLENRAKTQPVGTFNVGCIFKNPPKDFAAILIEQAGLKGTRSGGAQISERHANFFLNVKGATAQDIKTLILKAQRTVFDQFGVHLEPEIKMVGEGLEI
jgi:UDP-N-acetylmuramate dehydrogenase